MVHRDICTNSIFVHRRDTDAIAVKLGDVGVPMSGPNLGAPSHLAPELFEESLPGHPPVLERYTSAADIWALGAVLAELVCGLPDVDRDGWLWCEAITQRLQSNIEKTKDELAHFLLRHMLQLLPEERMEAGACYQRSLLLHDGPPAGGVTTGTADAVGDTRASDEDHESAGSEREMNESEQNESEENSSEASDSEDGVSEVETVVEAAAPAARDVRAHNTLELMTPAATSASASDDGGAETPQTLGRSDAPSPSTTAAAAERRRISAVINEPTASLFGESIFDESTEDGESSMDDEFDLIHEPETEAGTGGGDGRSVASGALASTVPQKRSL
ncbi:hypothetical protein QBC40DRAFT_183589 [Triangularia verruculosa]|uniref:non-specific serine/threonine protein kinase n=1 Tax=Triangularia verruculosa TaxID=2587418 RepID=A0AAN6X939_9PEZI|nr:hypothetical protein QBC40DRAFT_183589 [Triangularia verruculosa]